MKTLRDCESLLREKVAEINSKDENWRWSVKSLSKSRLAIRWEYLDYCGEKENCFYLVLSNEGDEYILQARDPRQELIGIWIAAEGEHLKSWQDKWESAIEYALNEIAYYAHSRY